MGGFKEIGGCREPFLPMDTTSPNMIGARGQKGEDKDVTCDGGHEEEEEEEGELDTDTEEEESSLAEGGTLDAAEAPNAPPPASPMPPPRVASFLCRRVSRRLTKIDSCSIIVRYIRCTCFVSSSPPPPAPVHHDQRRNLHGDCHDDPLAWLMPWAERRSPMRRVRSSSSLSRERRPCPMRMPFRSSSRSVSIARRSS